MTQNTESQTTQHKRLAIVGCGSSGLVTLKYARDALPDWDIVCFERSGTITGAWGSPYKGFVSTSTKYTTQFACFSEFGATAAAAGETDRPEFFRDGEFGAYLQRFAEAFELHEHIRLHTSVDSIERPPTGTGWELCISTTPGTTQRPAAEHFDAVILCTGLVADQKKLNCDIPQLLAGQIARKGTIEQVNAQRVIVIGGGESAVDYANRLAHPQLGNHVYLSLRSGIRVSPRYHPIRGVPSDFLRNRLLLSTPQAIRNGIGQRFVLARIRYRGLFEHLFPTRSSAHRQHHKPVGDNRAADRRKAWDDRLTRAAKDELFNVFHNKSDDFLDAVGEERIDIVGGPSDDSYQHYFEFDSNEIRTLSPDLIVPAIGYRSSLEQLSREKIHVTDFHLGCCHVTHDDLFLIGFARPIIGNIPSISEMQARYVTGLISGTCPRPQNIRQAHSNDRRDRRARYPQLNHDAVYPVEMFAYCDQLARAMGMMPPPLRIRHPIQSARMQLVPATTHYYLHNGAAMHRNDKRAPIHMPKLLLALLLLIKLASAGYGICRWAASGWRRAFRTSRPLQG